MEDTVAFTTHRLLLYNGGTVCDDAFSDIAADAICKRMCYLGSEGWTSEINSSEQYGYTINLDDVTCSDPYWESCSSSTIHNCGHREDVYITCTEGRLSRKILSNRSAYWLDCLTTSYSLSRLIQIILGNRVIENCYCE